MAHIRLAVTLGYTRIIGVGAPTPFTGGGGGCFVCRWRWLMLGFVISVHPCLIICIMKFSVGFSVFLGVVDLWGF